MRSSLSTKRAETVLFFLMILPIGYAALLAAPCSAPDIRNTLLNLRESLRHPFPPRWCSDSPRTLALFLSVYVFSVLLYRSTARNRRPGEEHGSARWGSPALLDRSLRQKDAIPLTRHVRLGMDTHRHLRNLNILVIGGSGAGKTRSVVLPGILSAAQTGSCSLVITDPKGECLRNTGEVLRRSEYRVRVFDLIDPDRSDGYNPFRYLRTDQDVLRLITNIIRNTTPKKDGSADPFWEKAETALLEALMFYLWYEAPEEEQNFGTIMDMLSFAEVREEESTFVSPLDKLFLDLQKTAPEHIAVRQYGVYRQAAGKTAKSILVSCAVRLSAFNLEPVRALVRTDGMELDRIGSEKTAVFAVIPDNDDSLSYLVGMLYTQIIQELYYEADHSPQGRLDRHVRLILDEFCNVSLPDSFDRSLATMRSREISATIIVQNLAQLKTLYRGSSWETLPGNCDTLLYLGGNEQSSHEYISKMLGKETISTQNRSESRGRSGSSSVQNGSSGRELLLPDEVRLLDSRSALLFVRGFRPVLDDKFELRRHPLYRQTAQGGGKPFQPGTPARAVPVSLAEALDGLDGAVFDLYEDPPDHPTN